MNNIIIFGSGDYYQKYKRCFTKETILAIADNNKDKIGTFIDGIKVISPYDIDKYDYDKVIICTIYLKSIEEQLIKLGISNDKISYYFEYHIISDKKYECEDNLFCQYKNVLLITHELSLSGAPHALIEMGRVLSELGYNVILASPKDGPAKSTAKKAGIKIIIDERLEYDNLDYIEWIYNNSFYMVVINTILLFYLLVNIKNVNKNIVWWIHDPELAYNNIPQRVYHKIDFSGIQMLAAGEIAANIFSRYNPCVPITVFHYGLNNYNLHNHKKVFNDKKIHFVMVGTVSYNKGHDILNDALKYLSNNIKKNMTITCIGDNKNDYAKKLMKNIDSNIITFTGTIPHAAVINEISKSDCLICASRQEIMSIAVNEALMLEKLVIVSDNIGNVKYIDNNVNGFTFDAENSKELSKIMRNIINNYESASIIAENGREIFQKYFSNTVFKENIINLLHKIKSNEVV